MSAHHEYRGDAPYLYHIHPRTADSGRGNDAVLQAQSRLVHKSRHHAQLHVLNRNDLDVRLEGGMDTGISTNALLAADSVLVDDFKHRWVDLLGALQGSLDWQAWPSL